MGVDMFRPAGGGMAKPCVLGHADNNAVIHQKPVFRTHQPIAAFADRQRGHHVGVHHVKELARIWSLHDQFAKGRGIKQPKAFARILDLTVYSVFNALTVTQIGIRPAPLTDWFIVGTVVISPVRDRRLADRLEQVILRHTRNRRHRYRCVGRAKRGGPDIRDIIIQSLRKDCETIDIAQLPLISRHA